MRGLLRGIGSVLGVVLRLRGGSTTTAPAAPDRPGSTTTEYRSTRIAQCVGVVVMAAGALWPDVPADELRAVLLWVGGLLLGVPTAAYASSRGRVKAAALGARASQAAAEALTRDARARRVADQIGGRR